MTPFQKQLKSYVWGYKAVERHWFFKEGVPRLLRVPSTGEQVTVRRAIYAAFRGDIPENVELRPTCGAGSCVAPDHQRGCPSRAGSRALHIPDLDGIGLDDRPNKLPKGLTFALITKVNLLGNSGSSLTAICAATALDRSIVMKVRGGVYDRVVASIKRGAVEQRRRRAERAEKLIPALEPMQPREESDYPEVDEAEVQAWLRSIQ